MNLIHASMMPVGYAQTLLLSSRSFLLYTFFTSVVRHGYVPGCIRDCVTTPILKGNKDPVMQSKLPPNCSGF